LFSLRSINSLNLGTILPLFSGTFNLVLDFYSLCSKNQHNLGAPPEHYFKGVYSRYSAGLSILFLIFTRFAHQINTILEFYLSFLSINVKSS